MSNSIVAADLTDLFVFDPSNLSWKELTGLVNGATPSPRDAHGFTSAYGKLYVFGGVFRPGS